MPQKNIFSNKYNLGIKKTQNIKMGGIKFVAMAIKKASKKVTSEFVCKLIASLYLLFFQGLLPKNFFMEKLSITYLTFFETLNANGQK
jgi:hypothetical protein